MDSLGNLIRFLLLPGQAHDTKGVAPLIRNVPFGALLADKAFDANWLLEELDARGASAVIPPKSNRKQQRNYDADAYKWRHMVENYFAKIREFRGIATRYDKTDCSYTANWNLAAALIASR
ncbi:hypothetical protein DWB67_17675 [Paracoccus sp. JM45]|nr:hypothetical protein DWB67_17675 [Paracoccus sp. JM45]